MMFHILHYKLMTNYAEVNGPLETKCWLFLGGSMGNGYGIIAEPGNNKVHHYAHRLSWQIHKGPIPAGMLVCHHCDNPSCVNPEHLFVGTQKDNTDDMLAKGRHDCNRVLTEEEVLDVIAILATNKYSNGEIAVLLGVGANTIASINRGITWQHLLPTGWKPQPGPGCKGERGGNARLTEADVRDILMMVDTGQYTLREIGEIFGVSESTICRIRKGNRWTHLQEV